MQSAHSPPLVGKSHGEDTIITHVDCERRLGIRLRRARGLMGREEGKTAVCCKTVLFVCVPVELNSFITVGLPFTSE